MRARSIVLALTWLLVLLCAFGLAVYFYVYKVHLPKIWQKIITVQETVGFEIKDGESIGSIAQNLQEAGVVTDTWALVEYLKSNDLDRQVEAGHFLFTGDYTIPRIAELLQTGGAVQVPFTVLEGWNSTEIDAMLVELGMLSDFGEFETLVKNPAAVTDFFKDRPVASLEGYIFPDTYFLDSESFSSADLISRMLQAMDESLKKADYVSVAKRSLHEILTMASIIELEEKSGSNRPLVADILWRRLDAGIALGADATLFYVLGHRDVLTAADLATDSPYNTRKNRGLPPTPVGSPSLSAIKSALNPQANDDWYYLHNTETGEIHFARTLEEHNRNKRNYIK